MDGVISAGSGPLWFGLRGAGPNFGVVTELLYTVYPRPETRPVLVPVWINETHDLEQVFQLQKRQDEWQIDFQLYEIGSLTNAGAMGFGILAAERLLRSLAVGEKHVPAVLTVSYAGKDAKRDTPTSEAVAYLKAGGIKVVTSSAFVLNELSRLANYGESVHYEGLTPYMPAVAGASVYFDDHALGIELAKDIVYGDLTPFGISGTDDGLENHGADCAFCFLAFNAPIAHWPASNGTSVNPALRASLFGIDLNCLYDPSRMGATCPGKVCEFQ